MVLPLGFLTGTVNGHQGCAHLLDVIRRIRPALHVFGHIHQAYGMASVNGTVFVNAALAGPGYRLIRQPIAIEYDRLTHSVRRIGERRRQPNSAGRKS
jgi:Icc-related predicted phosphoesterase